MLSAENLTLLYTMALATCAAVLTHFLLNKVFGQKALSQQLSPDAGKPVFLFEDDYLVDASPEAYRLVSSRSPGHSEKDALFHFLGPYFPNLKEELATLPAKSHLRLLAINDPDTFMDVELVDGITRFALCHEADFSAAHHYDALVRKAEQNESTLLQKVTAYTPQLIWREDHDGNLAWANRAYMEANDRFGKIPEIISSTWPKDPLFTGLAVPDIDQSAPFNVRASLVLPEENIEHWFEVTSVAVDDGVLRYATNIDAAVQAESAKQAFMQTLAKTFADLSVGLATFDNRRRLTVFNPAIHDILGLPIDFLSARPTLDSLLDRLRENRKVPEPRNYKTWREQFMALEAEAVKGTYCEVWELPESQTLRVTGRPHPSGGIALIFEDISTEVSLTRRFRTEIETGQAVIDTMPDAVAVFSRANTMVMMNKAYQELWRVDADLVDLNYDLRSAMRVWKAGSAPSSDWGRLEGFANRATETAPWQHSVILNDGRHVKCHATAIQGNMTMIKFVMTSKRDATVQKIQSLDPALQFADG